MAAMAELEASLPEEEAVAAQAMAPTGLHGAVKAEPAATQLSA